MDCSNVQGSIYNVFFKKLILIQTQKTKIKKMGKFYAVRVGRNKGIYNTWADCKKQIDKFKGAKYKSFTSESDANLFLEGNDFKVKKETKKSSPYPSESSQSLTHVYWNEKTNPIKKQRNKRKLFLRLQINKDNYEEHCLDVYTDGSCLDNSNPDKMKRRAGYGVYVSPEMEMSENIDEKQWRSNNCAELMAILVCIQKLKHTKKHLRILTDSKYACNIFECDGGILMKKEPFPKSIEDNDVDDIKNWLKEKLFEKRQISKAWYYSWLDKDKFDYENKSLIDNIFKEINAYKKDVRLIHIPGHKKIFGNEKADLLAKNAAMKE